MAESNTFNLPDSYIHNVVEVSMLILELLSLDLELVWFGLVIFLNKYFFISLVWLLGLK